MTKKKPIDKSIIITAILALAALEMMALYQGINGKLFAIIIAVIAGLAGWVIPTPKLK